MASELITRDGRIVEVLTPVFDSHLHGRKAAMMRTVLPQYAQRMCGGILMPNLNPHLYTFDDNMRYLGDAQDIAPDKRWLGSAYLGPTTSRHEVLKCWQYKILGTVKSYPVSGSTHSDESAPHEMMLDKNSEPGMLLSMAEDEGIPVTFHGEVVTWQGEEVDAYDRERIFYQEVAPRFRDTYPRLKRISAHITSEEGAAYAEESRDSKLDLFEYTSHHLAVDRRALYMKGFLRPDYHCLPVIKESKHTAALRRQIKKRRKNATAASDAAPHSKLNKYADCCFGGIYTGHCSTELYIQILDRLDALDYAEDFLFGNAKRFFGELLPNNPPLFRFVREDWTVGKRIQLPFDDEITPFGYGLEEKDRFKFEWKLAA